jgi:hypothetical protein
VSRREARAACASLSDNEQPIVEAPRKTRERRLANPEPPLEVRCGALPEDGELRDESSLVGVLALGHYE